jgi:hypothetical protein
MKGAVMSSAAHEYAERLASAIVEGSVRDDWESYAEAVSGFLSHGEDSQEEAIAEELRLTRAEILDKPPVRRSVAMVVAAGRWSERIEHYLDDDLVTAAQANELEARLRQIAAGIQGPGHSFREAHPGPWPRMHDDGPPAAAGSPPGTSFGDGDD